MAEHKNPKVFLSYSWDDSKDWVLEFAARLRSDGVDTILDQWHVAPGDSLPEFMEKSVSESDFVLVICTPAYKRKSESEHPSGVVYEKGVITGELFVNRNQRKFIPILRKGKWKDAAPSWVLAKTYIDLSNNPYSETNYMDLLRTLHGKREPAPPLGSPPDFETKVKEALEKVRKEKEAKAKKEAEEEARKVVVEKARKEKERIEKEKAEQETLEKARKEREAEEKKEAEEKARQIAEEKTRKEQERIEKEKAEQEALEKVRKEREAKEKARKEKAARKKRAREAAKAKEPAQNPAGIEWIKIPAGEFTMGGNDGYKREKPPHKVYLDEYFMAKMPVTNAQFKKFMNADGYKKKEYWSELGWKWLSSQNRPQPRYWNDKKWNTSTQPVVSVCWYEAEAFAKWANCRLPSEAEWEKAARGTDARKYPWGNRKPNKNLANYDLSWSAGKTTPVGKYSPAGDSPYGCVDMAGNVWEWSADWYDAYPGGDASAEDDFGEKYRVLRGGSWHRSGNGLRSTYRVRSYPSLTNYGIGFRCSRSRL